ncbi:hypothetical protein Hdeb2414_s0007g00234351 [Helianthus debilis subsp. tardiflorus]
MKSDKVVNGSRSTTKSHKRSYKKVTYFDFKSQYLKLKVGCITMVNSFNTTFSAYTIDHY